jgi:hypothetical protein
MKRPGDDLHERVAHLYFSRGWPLRSIGERYRLPKAMVHRLVSDWRIRAVAAGYIQEIHPEHLDPLLQVKDEPELQLSELSKVENAGSGTPAAGGEATDGRAMAFRAGV